MPQESGRKFEAHLGKRERVPLLVGLFGASGSGKTYSALRLATGMQRVTGGEIYGIDTEHRRMLHYADRFAFQHVELSPPFSPNDYREVLEYVAAKRPGVVIVDSMSHEHDGPGGVLEWHDRIMGSDFKKSMTAWIEPKKARNRLIQTILQLGINAIFCFRAKEKVKVETGKEPKQLGWMPIAGDEYLFEMTLNVMLYPASGGAPTWETSQPGERMMMKLPAQFVSEFQGQSVPLSEDLGERLALWAAGDAQRPDPVAALLAQIATAQTVDALSVISREAGKQKLATGERSQISVALKARKDALASGPERDPNTGEIIPDHIGRDPEQPELGDA